MSKVPDYYGDNFPVPSGSWDPAIPWRFPKHAIRLKKPTLMSRILPWLMLGMGMVLGVLLMSSRMGVPPADAQATASQNTSVESKQQLLPPSDFAPREPVRGVPKAQPKRNRSGLV